MEPHHCWFYSRTATVKRSNNKNHIHGRGGHSVQAYKIYNTETGTKDNSTKASTTNAVRSLYLDQNTETYCIGPGQTVHVKILGNHYGGMRDWAKAIHGQPPTDRWTIRKNDSIYWTVSAKLPGLEPGQLGRIAADGTVRSKQRKECNNRYNTPYCKPRTTAEDALDKSTSWKGSEPAIIQVRDLGILHSTIARDIGWAEERMNFYYNKKHEDTPILREGDQVYLLRRTM